MTPIVAAGGILVDCDAVLEIERSLNELCNRTGFPLGEEFKWSPTSGAWMRTNLVDAFRANFFVEVLEILKSKACKAIVVAEDTAFAPANGQVSPVLDVTKLLLERVHQQCQSAIIVADRPGGKLANDDQYIAGCLDIIQNGTKYLKPNRIAFSVTTNSKFVRLLQAADVVTACVTARVAGEGIYSPPIFNEIRQMFPHSTGRQGGIGLKIHPDGRYANLYHWLLDDAEFPVAGRGNIPLPRQNRPYAQDEHTP